MMYVKNLVFEKQQHQVEDFQFLVGKVDQKLMNWNNQLISRGGKVILLKTAAQSIPNFWMQLFLIPNVVCDKIEKRMDAFLWGKGGSSGGIKWLSWDRVCVVKEEGGLGFKKLRDFNISMLEKQAWRLILECNPLVSQVMKARYYPKSDFLNAAMGSNPSYLWRSLVATQKVMNQGMPRRIGNGLTTIVWKVPWLPDLENAFPTTGIYEQLQDIKVQSLLAEDQKSWDVEIISDLFTERDKQLILQIPIPLRDREDSWYWALEDKGIFSVKSCYRKIKGEYACVDRMFWKKIWGLQLPGKMLNFIWRACLNVFPTAVALQSKRVDINPQCSWCHVGMEDAVHLLFECSIAREIWKSVGLQDAVRVIENDTVMVVFK